MDRWAGEGKYDCNFLCVCMLADSSASHLSMEFANQLKLQHCINAFIDNHMDAPEYGQLGCGGFIVMDETHNVVSTCTSPFMQVRSLAFAHVETLLDAILAKQPTPQVCPGEFVRILTSDKDTAGATAICLQIDKGGSLLLQVLTGAQRQKQIRLAASDVWKLGSESDPEKGCHSSECGSRCSATGGCEPVWDDSQKDDSPVDEDFIASKLSLVSVRVPSMDAEHIECADALRRLAAELSMASLETTLATLSEHFAHEEALFDQHGFGEHADVRFSAKRTHIEDHNRLLEKMRQQLRSQGPVPSSFVRGLLQDFHEHTSRYDVQYSELLSSKCVG
eukprot:TRINITY_DN31245_c0_g1_i1.p1 TRINITY_DN31245_c0_g1~~TRINITY_DN31245_c0_g1_i1.p1  ORF type:complete len:335 (-),score=54.46 TRINITY_DN31245_c0_g1_i1:385-1389(-)